MYRSVISLVAVVLLLGSTSHALKLSTCTNVKNHPLYSSDMSPVLIKCWSFMNCPKLPKTAYIAQYKKHRYAPVSDLDSLSYDELDWFWATSGHGDTSDFIQFHFNRHARVYLTIPVHRNTRMGSVSLPGWKAMGEVNLVKGIEEPFEFGVFQKFPAQPTLPERAYIFMKRGKDVEIPHLTWVEKNLRGFDIPNGYRLFAMFAETDGSKWEYPSWPSTIRHKIKPNEQCPKDLHNQWVARNTDDDDPDTAGKYWRTWHPLWDPIYWCTYGHEHGSSPVDLFGYWPKYEYTAWKNKREDESNEGFKTLCVKTSTHGICYTVHMQTSHLRRVYERWHTIQMAVIELATGKLVADISHKGDFGGLMVRIPNARFMPVAYEDMMLMNQMKKQPKRRSINILSPDGKEDSRLQYRFPKMSMGVYEDWTTVPICAAGGRKGNIRADVTKSATGIPAFDKKDEMVYLGDNEAGKFFRQTGVARLLIVRNFMFGASFCESNFGEDVLKNKGVFYTNSEGTELRDGPSKFNIKQFVDPNLKIILDGEYRAVDTFAGLLDIGSEREMEDVGYGINPDMN